MRMAEGKTLKETAGVIGLALGATVCVVSLIFAASYFTQQESATTQPTESTTTIGAYIDAITEPDDKWETVTVEKFNPDKASSTYSDEGMTERKTTIYHYDRRVKAGKGKK